MIKSAYHMGPFQNSGSGQGDRLNAPSSVKAA